METLCSSLSVRLTLLHTKQSSSLNTTAVCLSSPQKTTQVFPDLPPLLAEQRCLSTKNGLVYIQKSLG